MSRFIIISKLFPRLSSDHIVCSLLCRGIMVIVKHTVLGQKKSDNNIRETLLNEFLEQERVLYHIKGLCHIHQTDKDL